MRIRLTVAAILACYAGGAGAAADWSFDPKVITQFETDDNNRLTNVRGSEVSVEGIDVDAQLGIRAQTPRSDFHLFPRVKASFYDHHDEERQMGAVTGDLRYRGEKWSTRVDGSWSVRTILGRLDPEDDGGLGEPDPGTGAGRSTQETDQYSLLLKPRFDFALTERVALLLQARYKDVEFDDQVENDRQNYEDIELATGLSFRTSPTASFSVLAGASQYEPEDGFDSESQFVTADWTNAMSETSQYYFRGGATRVKNDGDPNADWETGFSGGAGIEWKFEVTVLFLDYNHYLDPSASGRMVNRDQLRFELLREFSERSNLLLSGRAVMDEKAQSEDDFEKRKYFTGAVQYEWRFRQQFSLIGGYEYTWREYEDDLTDAVSNRFFLGVRYQPHRR